MSDEPTPLVPPSHGRPAERILRSVFPVALRVSLWVSPRPAALLVRRVFAVGGAKTAEALDRHAPGGVIALIDERYGDEPDMLLDVYRPASATTPLPLLLWVHGGGFVGGAKEELAGYFKLLAHDGYVVVGPRYSLAPEHHYPAPSRQIMHALGYLISNRDRLLIDPERIALAGDSAGAHIAAQLAALVTTPGYSATVGINPTITSAQLRGVILACGPYDLGLARQSIERGSRFVQIVLWAYTGKRNFLDDPAAAAWSLTQNLTPSFPTTLVTVGNADPLRPHSELLVEKLRAHGVTVETVFYPDDHQPALGHEYQFDIDSEPGRMFLDRARAFLRQLLEPSQS
ncbi:MAG TPA: alpha/beta hydrolase [Solirubrobacteraceae bacterium]|nr:alpha/beta hydrolase [Solirubrobacteraceae bacterium]